ncbi:hypothetical protein BCT21_04860 [Vibrio sp. 10N.222.55.F9]|uniref:CDP-glycerol glycerophosphotransferase family protein n=1 Tax=Vibrio sp. 10N.222.55.F9 TaxID=1884471 RepID=UPI000C852AD7|nr:CDP-glycerol glycerophosphotransferase family protein [Vibrio sp. 10N.222.55.F9]PMO06761.1 hypothetical protein BCT21_04860 [Vibrio sp. 10N.222.55.F9]
MLRNALRRFKNILIYPIGIIDYFWPKKNNYILCCSDGMRSLNGNVLKLFIQLAKEPNFKVRYYSKKKEYSNYVNLRSLRGLLFFLNTRYLIGSHGHKDFFYPFSSKKIYIQTWHGIPLKAMGALDKNRKARAAFKNGRFDKIDYFLSSSNYVSHLFSRCFNIQDDRFLLSGYPRNDHLLHTSSSSKLREKYNCDYAILYAPTFRDWKTNGSYPFDEQELKTINKHLLTLNAKLFFRLHPNDKLTFEFNRYSQIVEFSSEQETDINAVLPCFDMLITDYSSIYFDFLLTGGDCVLFPYDLDEYIAKRGILFDSYSDCMVDRAANDFCSLIDLVFNCTRSEYELSEVERIKNLFFQCQTDNSYKNVRKIFYDL